MGHQIKPIALICLDNNILNPMLAAGFGQSVNKLSEQIKNRARRIIKQGETILLVTPSNFFEYCGVGPETVISPTELIKMTNDAEDGDE